MNWHPMITVLGIISAAVMGSPAPAAPARLQPVEAHYAPSSQPIPFELFRGQRIFVSGTINGVPASMMLDSGAGMTSVNRAFAEKLGLKASGTAVLVGDEGSTGGQIATDVSLDVGGLHLEHLRVVIFDLGPAIRGIGRDIPVILGREVFDPGIVSIDFQHLRILFCRSFFVSAASRRRSAPSGSRRNTSDRAD
jgi:hypothetical protein